MPKASKGKKFYAVQKGRQTGVFLTWKDCEIQTKGYSGAKYQSFTNAADAEAFVSGTLSKNTGPSAPSTSSSFGDVPSPSKRKKRAMPRDVEDESEHDVVYCDGACKGNGQPGSIAGVGVWWEENDPRNIAERCPGDQTNNRAELIAIVRMLETTPKSKRPLLIKTDSQYCINCFLQWLPKWKRNNFRTAGGAPVKNVGIIKYVSALLEARALVGQPVRMEYVRGHSGDRGNDGADAQANQGALLPPVPERDWAKAKRELLERMEEERKLSKDQPTPALLDLNAGVLEQATNQPRKVRKVSHDVPFSSVPASTEPSNSEQPPTDSSTTQIRSPSPPHVTSSPPPLPVIEVSSSPSPQPQPTPSPPPCNADLAQPAPPLPVIEVSSSPSPQPQPTPSPPPCNADPAQPPPPLPVIEVSPSPPRETGPSQPQPTPSPPPCNADPAQPEPEPEPEIIKVASPIQPSTGESNKPPEVPKTPVRKHGVGLFTTTPPPNASFVRKFSTLPSESQGAKESAPVPQDEEKIEKAIEEPTVMGVDATDVDENEAKDLESVPQAQENEEPIVMSVDTANVDLKEVKDSSPVPLDREENEKPIEEPVVMSRDAADVDLNETKESEPVPQDWEENEKPIEEPMVMSVDAADVNLNGVKESESAPQDKEENEKPIEQPTVEDVDLNEAEESESVPQDQEKIEKSVEEPMAMSVDAADIDPNEAKESEVPQDQEENKKPMAMSVDTADVDLNGVEESEPVTEGQEDTEQPERPMAMSVDASDVDLNDYLDCIDDDDDPFDDI